MTIEKQRKEAELIIRLSGRLDTGTAPQLEQELQVSIEGVTKLIIDMKGLVYLSSAGLRVILAAQKTMNRQGSMVIRGVNGVILNVFEATGFVDILTIEAGC